jgi:hypothetical protein
VTILPRAINPVLEPMSLAPFTCPFRGLMRVDGQDAADRLTGSQVFITAEYDTLVFGRSQSQSDVFTLDTHTLPPQWVVGNPLK